MARSRNIKPGIFKNEILGTEDPLLTILFEGLWCHADREGRLEDRPRRIKAEIFPYREALDINRYLTELAQFKFILRYEVAGVAYIEIIKFLKHQNPHKTEKPSEIPPPQNKSNKNSGLSNNGKSTVQVPLNNGSCPADSLNTDSLNTDSLNVRDPKQKTTENNPTNKNKKRFVKPSVDDVRAYCVERNNKIDAEFFINHYESNGWKVGKTKMVDWKAAVRTWEKNEYDRSKSNQQKSTASDYLSGLKDFAAG